VREKGAVEIGLTVRIADNPTSIEIQDVGFAQLAHPNACPRVYLQLPYRQIIRQFPVYLGTSSWNAASWSHRKLLRDGSSTAIFPALPRLLGGALRRSLAAPQSGAVLWWGSRPLRNFSLPSRILDGPSRYRKLFATYLKLNSSAEHFRKHGQEEEISATSC